MTEYTIEEFKTKMMERDTFLNDPNNVAIYEALMKKYEGKENSVKCPLMGKCSPERKQPDKISFVRSLEDTEIEVNNEKKKLSDGDGGTLDLQDIVKYFLIKEYYEKIFTWEHFRDNGKKFHVHPMRNIITYDPGEISEVFYKTDIEGYGRKCYQSCPLNGKMSFGDL